jgi:hypothetical protein
MKREETIDYHIRSAWHAISRMYNQRAQKYSGTMSMGFSYCFKHVPSLGFGAIEIDYLYNTMSTKDVKYELIEKLIKTDDESVLEQVRVVLEGSTTKIWDDLNPKLKEAINIGIEQSNEGLGAPHEEVMKSARSRVK